MVGQGQTGSTNKKHAPDEAQEQRNTLTNSKADPSERDLNFQYSVSSPQSSVEAKAALPPQNVDDIMPHFGV